MAGEIFRFDENRVRELEALCLCHGRDHAASDRKAKRVSWLPSAAQVNVATMRPVIELAMARLQDRQAKLPHWTQRLEVERLPLLRVDRWIEEASATLREPALGLMALAQVQRGRGQVVELAAECSNTLGDALLVLARYIGILNEAASFHLHIEGARAVLVMGSRLLLSHVARDYLAGLVGLSVARWRGSSAGLELWFAGARPTYAPSYRSVLQDISVGFEASCDALVIPTASLSAPLPSADPKLHDFLVRLAQRVAASPLVD